MCIQWYSENVYLCIEGMMTPSPHSHHSFLAVIISKIWNDDAVDALLEKKLTVLEENYLTITLQDNFYMLLSVLKQGKDVF